MGIAKSQYDGGIFFKPLIAFSLIFDFDKQKKIENTPHFVNPLFIKKFYGGNA
jgi:hypothetical protein